jgi:hemolysin III
MREPVNTWTHFIGIFLSIAGLTTMVVSAAMDQNPISLAGGIIFGLSMILLYTASTVYHWYNGSPKVILKLKKIDHAMIFVLIAGTYTPICLIALGGKLGTYLLVGIWGLALIGIVTKMLFIHMPRILSAGIYLFMGWISVAFIYPLSKTLDLAGFFWLVAGGLLYTIGAIFYASKSERIKIGVFGFHEIFHLFIMAGTAAHFILIQGYII